jgi:hypothetical protein
MIRNGDHLWGTGVASDDTINYRCKRASERNNGRDLIRNLTIYSTRGPKSAAQILQLCGFTKEPVEAAGDAGYLVPFLFPEVMVKNGTAPTKEYCAVPHAQEEKNPVFRRVPSHLMLSVRQPWINMTLALQDCKEVISSSLHGIILSETLRIPSRRLKLTNKPGNFKFGDFYESLRGGVEPDYTKNITYARENLNTPLTAEENDKYARRILKTFPIHLFNVQRRDADGRLEKSSPGTAHVMGAS